MRSILVDRYTYDKPNNEKVDIDCAVLEWHFTLIWFNAFQIIKAATHCYWFFPTLALQWFWVSSTLLLHWCFYTGSTLVSNWYLLNFCMNVQQKLLFLKQNEREECIFYMSKPPIEPLYNLWCIDSTLTLHCIGSTSVQHMFHIGVKLILTAVLHELRLCLERHPTINLPRGNITPQ